MADRPVLFSAPMVRALLAGTKTQTRREIKPRGTRPSIFNGGWTDSYVLDPGNASWRQQDIRIAVGDRLYVREHWRTAPEHDGTAPRDFASSVPLCFLADTGLTFPNPLWGKHRQAMHMPRWASRLTLTVTDVKVERLQDISHEDAMAEGLVQLERKAWIGGGPLYGLHEGEGHDTATGAYNRLWRDINGDGSWAANPWVVAYTFSVQHGNIDQIAQVAA